eukprot:1330124-Pleurochrysis_carterae.AAC.4
MQEERRSHVPSVSEVLKQVLSSRVTSCSKQGGGAFNQNVGLVKLALVLRRNVRKSRNVVSISDRRRSPVRLNTVVMQSLRHMFRLSNVLKGGRRQSPAEGRAADPPRARDDCRSFRRLDQTA